MQKILNLLTSMKLAMVLVLIFAISCATATFIENDYGTQTAKALVYNAHWFEALQLILGVMLATIMIRHKIYLKPKTPVFLLHISFLLILLGSALTRFIGFEGVLHVREGEIESKMLSSEPYITVKAPEENGTVYMQKRVLFSSVGKENFSASFDVDGKSYNLNLKEYVPNAVKTVEQVLNGKPIISFVVSDKTSEPMQKLLTAGETFEYGDTIFAFNKDVNATNKKVIRIAAKDGKFYIASDSPIRTLEMASQLEEVLSPTDVYEFKKGKLYSTESLQFVPRALFAS